MRRAAVIAGFLAAALWIASPAQAFAHNAVQNQTLHSVLDGLTLLVATSPVWTALLWRGQRRWLSNA
jgi:tRNA C32,U32 (ribose-2'-O)-methylase TrmJ